jgi:enoyl-CoA hydratase/carnithine racemase
MALAQILTDRQGAVVVITMNRPERLNAWTPQMAAEMARAIEGANADPAIGAIVLAGAGRGFCAGADMEATFRKRLDGVDPGADTAGGDGGMPAGLDWVALVRASKPMVAAVQGAAVGIGMTQILPMDVLVAGPRARFGMLFIKMGLVPELASSHLLVQRMGFGRASEMCLSGRLYGAEEALAAGLVDHLVEEGQELARAVEIARSMAENPDPQLRMIKQLLTRNACETDLPTVQQRETELLRACWKSPEHAEAVAAFLEKRPPKFR